MIGLAATAVVAALHLTGAFDRFEFIGLDWRFRHCNRMRTSDLILHVDINDDALKRIHGWPWPRRLHAQLVDTLHELGARSIVMDLVFAERQRPRQALPYARSEEELATRFHAESGQEPIFDDSELAASIARAGNVYLAMFFDPAVDNDAQTQARRWFRQTLEKHPDWSTQRLIGQAIEEHAGFGMTTETLREIGERMHLAHLLRQRFDSTADVLALRTGLDREAIDRVLPGLKRQAAASLAKDALEQNRNLERDQFVDRILRGVPRDPLDVLDIQAAYDTETAIRSAMKRTVAIPPERQGLFSKASTVTPPLSELGTAAKDSGFVTFETTSVDGVLREVPLVACFRGRMIRQLAFAAFCDLVDVAPDRIEMTESDRLVLRDAQWPGDSKRRDVVLPLDEEKGFLLNWYGGQGRWETAFDHVAVGRVLEIPINRAAAEDQRRRALAAAVRFTTTGGAEATFERYVKTAQDRDRARRRLALAPQDDPQRADLEKLLAAADKQTATIEENAVGVIRAASDQIKGLTPESEEERREFGRIRQIVHELERAAALARRVQERIAELRPLADGKVCFVGYTATAVADFVSTPVFDRAPGVVAHANLFHTLYTGQIVRRAPKWLGLLLIVACGLMLTSVIATWQGPIVSLLTTAIGLNLVVIAASVLLFYQWRTWIIVPAVLASVLASWGLITAYRQLTEGREKRLAFSRLGQYTSPTLARRIAEDPRVLSGADAREVTCYFSDLKGFTPISERLGAERTQALLNVYLERMSEVLDRHEAFINKFLGDGVFAFFNPAVNPQPDHVHLACEAALDSLTALADLIAEKRGDQGAATEFDQLEMRIGLATGTVVVGNCGSHRKFDYTCIGDTVNLAARLESANKAFGTRIMVAESTRAASRDLYDWRYLGGLQVVGKKQTVAVYELLGRKGDVPDATLEYAARFEQGVKVFQEGRWVDCITHFTRMLARRPDDAGLTLYIDCCQQFQRFGPPTDWSGEIQLTEK